MRKWLLICISYKGMNIKKMHFFIFRTLRTQCGWKSSRANDQFWKSQVLRLQNCHSLWDWAIFAGKTLDFGPKMQFLEVHQNGKFRPIFAQCGLWTHRHVWIAPCLHIWWWSLALVKLCSRSWLHRIKIQGQVIWGERNLQGQFHFENLMRELVDS